MRAASESCLLYGTRVLLVLALVACLRPMPAVEGDSIVPDRTVADQLAAVEVEVLIERADELQAEGEHRQALGRLQEARLRVERAAFPDRQQMIERLEDRLARAERLQRQAEELEYAGRRRLAQERAIDSRDRAQRQARSRFEERLHRIVDLRERRLLELALERSRLLVSDYPDSDLARETYGRILDEVHEQRRLDTDERLRALRQELNDEIARSLVPRGFDGAPVFPDDWQRRFRRESGILGADLPSEDAVVRNRLAERVSVDFDGLDAGECVDLLSGRARLNMVVDADVRANPGHPVVLRARNMRLDHVLDWIAQQADVQWRIENRAVFVTRQDEAEVYTRLYDIGMLLYGVPDFPGSEIGFNGGDNAMAEYTIDFADEDTGLAPEDLTDLITATLGEELWDREGHGMSVFGTQMIATCTPVLHTQLQDFISRFQQGDDIQVNVRSRWVALRKGLVEEIGVDWQDALTNPVFPVDPNDPANSFPQPPAVTNDGRLLGWWRESPDFYNAGNITNVLPGSEVAPLVGSNLAQSGLSLSFGYLGTWQLAAMFRAVEQERQGRFLDAIDLTARNGSQANAHIGRSIAYISDFEVEVGAGDDAIGVFNPVISTLDIGMGLEIRPLVSADRKFVTLDLEPQLVLADVSIVAFDAFTQLQAGRDDDDTTLSLGQESTFEVQLPTVEHLSVHTRVMIPDGGSILVGGLKRSIRESSKAQVPLLGDIPFVGRLFSRRGRYELDEEYYLMASVKIFLYEELEAQL